MSTFFPGKDAARIRRYLRAGGWYVGPIQACSGSRRRGAGAGRT